MNDQEHSDVDVAGTKNLLAAARMAPSVEAFVFTSEEEKIGFAESGGIVFGAGAELAIPDVATARCRDLDCPRQCPCLRDIR